MVLWFERTLESDRLRQIPFVFTAYFATTYNFHGPDNHPGWKVARFQPDYVPRLLIRRRHARINIDSLTLVCRHAAIFNLLLAAENLLGVRLAKTESWHLFHHEGLGVLI